MNTKHFAIHIKSLLLGAFLTAAIILSIAAATGPNKATKWEYKIIAGKVLGSEDKLDANINGHTAQGWEFVSASHSTEQYGFAVMRREK